MPDENLHQFFKIRRKKGWSIRRAWTMLRDLSDNNLEPLTVPVLYRPFDIRWIFYHDSLVWRTVQRVMRHMLAGENIALILPKRVEHVGNWQHTFICKTISDHVAVSLKTIDYHFPLYLYPNADHHDLFAHHKISERRPNLNPELVKMLTTAYGREPTPEDIFNYVYAVLYAPTYREKYSEFLHMDFPRIPFTADREVFRSLSGLGARLVSLHLLKSPELDPPAARFEGDGDGKVAKSKSQGFSYDHAAQRVSINQTQYFAPVTATVWEYQIGGYQVCEKWLKDRRGRKLVLDDIRHYCRVVTALARTIEIQLEIDTLYPEVEADTISISEPDT
jgi:predicted helicase